MTSFTAQTQEPSTPTTLVTLTPQKSVTESFGNKNSFLGVFCVSGAGFLYSFQGVAIKYGTQVINPMYF